MNPAMASPTSSSSALSTNSGVARKAGCAVEKTRDSERRDSRDSRSAREPSIFRTLYVDLCCDRWMMISKLRRIIAVFNSMLFEIIKYTNFDLGK